MQPVSSTRRILAAAVAAALLPAVVQADPTSDELLQKIEELSQKVLVLERKLEVQDEATKAAVATAPVVKASPRGFSIASADSRNQLKLRGVVHVDGRFFGSDDPEGLKDTWQATRAAARLVFPGRIAELAAATAQDRAVRALATDSYASAALLEHHLRGEDGRPGVGRLDRSIQFRAVK